MKDHTVLITGAANGIGRASAHAFSGKGAHVVVTDIDEEGARAVAGEIGERALAQRLDVTDRHSIEAAFAAAEAAMGPVSILHANAGVSNLKRAVDLDEEDWDFNFNVNAKGVFLTNQTAVRHFQKHNIAGDRKSTRLNSSHNDISRMPSSA